MTNPWLSIPLSDYEQHMSSDAVQQLAPLSDLFAEALMVRRPGSLTVVGVAGGNGLERIPAESIERVVGIDLHAEYMKAVQQRFPALPLELHEADLGEEGLAKRGIAPVDLVHIALVFEHIASDPERLQTAIRNAISLLKEDGALSVVLQVHSAHTTQGDGSSTVASGVASIAGLLDDFTLIAPKDLKHQLSHYHLEPVWESQRQVPDGKSLWMGIFTTPEEGEVVAIHESEHGCCGH